REAGHMHEDALHPAARGRQSRRAPQHGSRFARSMSVPAAASAPQRGAHRRGDADNFRLLADFAPVMIWIADPARKCVYFNHPWLEFTGRRLEDELGEGWIEGIHGEDREGTLAAYARAFEAIQPFETQFRLRPRDGDYPSPRATGVPLAGGNPAAGLRAPAL